MRALLIPFAAAILLLPAIAAAQNQAQTQNQKGLLACPNQDELEQHIQSGGQLVPENCRQITVTRVATPSGSLCVIDFGEEDPGVVGTIVQQIDSRQWWVACDQLSPPAQ